MILISEMLAALKTAKKNKEQQNLPDSNEEHKNTEASSPVVIVDKQEPNNSNVENKEK